MGCVCGVILCAAHLPDICEHSPELPLNAEFQNPLKSCKAAFLKCYLKYKYYVLIRGWTLICFSFTNLETFNLFQEKSLEEKMSIIMKL